MMIRCMCTDRQRQAVTTHNTQDFHAFSTFGRTNLRVTTLRRCKYGIDETLRFINISLFAKSVGQID